tara:strand:- start:147 stop:440 length:294 start_codon:yes stop_codon:yes gene_type:complete
MKNKSLAKRAEEQMNLIELKDVVQEAEAHSLREYENFIDYKPDGLGEFDNVKCGIECELFGMYCELFTYEDLEEQNHYDLIRKRASELFLEWEVINN